MPEPWLADWNRAVMEALFHVLPHSGARVNVAEFLTLNPLVSTLPFAAVFYLQWRIEDERTIWRRSRLLEVIVAFAAGMAFSLILRIWISWPAPTLSPVFREMFPDYIWGLGNLNSFPSHSTLAYTLAGAGMYSIRKRLGVLMFLFVLAAISFPRVYIGGHYPIDVVVSLALAFACLWAARRVGRIASVQAWLERMAAGNGRVELFVFLWLFEMAEGFRGTTTLLRDFLKAKGYLGY
jgi:undecaprenyl-diphosphatase